MLARDGSPALIEINTSPALFRHGAVLRSTLPEMMEEVCRLTLDRVFPPPTGHDRVKSASGEKTENEEKEKARFRELDVVVDLAVESSKSAVRARRSSASPEKKKSRRFRAPRRAQTRAWYPSGKVSGPTQPREPHAAHARARIERIERLEL